MKIIQASEVRPKSIKWAWEGKVPLGEITVVSGPPGAGKSTLLLQLASDWSNGLVEGNLKDKPCKVLIISEEDPVEILRIRLYDAEGHLDRIHIGSTNYESGFRLSGSELNYFRKILTDIEPKILIIDPFVSYLDDKIDTRSDKGIRKGMEPLGEIARDFNLSIVLVAHLNKSQISNPMYRISGSVGIVALARSVLVVMPDPKAEPAHPCSILAQIKSSYSIPTHPLRFSTERTCTTDENGRFSGYIPGIIDWRGEAIDITLDDLFSEGSDGSREELKMSERWLKKLLLQGPQSCKNVFTQAKESGISEFVLRRASAKLKVEHRRIGFGRGSYVQWVLP